MIRFIIMQKRLKYFSDIVSGLKEHIPNVNEFKLVPENDLIKIFGWDNETLNIVKLSLKQLNYNMTIHDYITEISRKEIIVLNDMDKLIIVNEKLLDECIEYLKDENKYYKHIEKCVYNMINLENKFNELTQLEKSLDPESIKLLSRM